MGFLRVQFWVLFFFLLYINDIQYAVDPNILRLFADDTGLFLHNKNLGALITLFKNCFPHLKKWFVANKLTLNETKTFFSIFHARNKFVPPDLQDIRIDNMVVKRTQSAKYIGLIIDELLNWKDHVNTLIKSLLKYFGIFNNIKNGISEKNCKTIILYIYLFQN